MLKKILNDRLLVEKYDVTKVNDLISEITGRPFVCSFVRSLRVCLIDRLKIFTADRTDKVLNSVKSLNYEGYKIVVQCSLGEFNGQGLRFASKANWDEGNDQVVMEEFHNQSLFATVFVYGIFVAY